MDPARQREIARIGGAAVAPERRAFSQNRELAISAGRKGGQGPRRSNRTERSARTEDEGHGR